MHIVTLQILRDDNHIKIRMDDIKDESLLHGGYYKSVEQILQEEFSYKEAVTNQLFKPTALLPIKCLMNTKAFMDYEVERVTIRSTIYQLPTQALCTLDLLSAMAIFINQNSIDRYSYVDQVLIVDQNMVDKFGLKDVSNKQIDVSLSGYSIEMAKCLVHHTKFIDTIIDQIHKLNHPLYANFTEDETKLRTYFKNYSLKPFLENLRSLERFGVVFDLPLEQCTALNETSKKQLELLYLLSKKYLGWSDDKLKTANRSAEFNALLNQINLAAKIKLYTPCLGKTAADGIQYTFYYTEWYLLRDAEFLVQSDGRLSIKLADNPSYKEYYAKDKRNHTVMEKEFRHLAEILNLQFADDTNFHDTLIFTHECSKRLINQGLHYNQEYFKRFLQTKNLHHFFKRAYLGAEGSLFYHQPKEVLQEMLSYVHPLIIKDDLEKIKKEWDQPLQAESRTKLSR